MLRFTMSCTGEGGYDRVSAILSAFMLRAEASKMSL